MLKLKHFPIEYVKFVEKYCNLKLEAIELIKNKDYFVETNNKQLEAENGKKQSSPITSGRIKSS